MAYPEEAGSGLSDTISSLRVCNALQSEVIANMEHYQATVIGVGEEDTRSGRRFGYKAELSYLQDRRVALDALIDAVEKYYAASDGGLVHRSSEE
jgi:hypothetical protein